MHAILLVEDSAEAHFLVQRALGDSVELEWADSLKKASQALSQKTFDLILLDIMLPDGDGYRLCSNLQANEKLRNIPVMFLTAKNSVADKVRGFSVGADDFISKPFEQSELRARIDARLRRRDREKSEADTITIGKLKIDKGTQRVYVVEQGLSTVVDLTPIEFKLLLFLCKDLTQSCTREEILHGVWGDGIHVYSRSVDTHISKLRKKLGSCSSYISSVHGRGYRVAVDHDVRFAPVDVSTHSLLY